MKRPFKEASETQGRIIADRFFAGRNDPQQVTLKRSELVSLCAIVYELGANMAMRIQLGSDEGDEDE